MQGKRLGAGSDLFPIQELVYDSALPDASQNRLDLCFVRSGFHLLYSFCYSGWMTLDKCPAASLACSVQPCMKGQAGWHCTYGIYGCVAASTALHFMSMPVA
jgi:hypothetical protein